MAVSHTRPLSALHPVTAITRRARALAAHATDDRVTDRTETRGMALGAGAVLMVAATLVAAAIPAADPGWRFAVVAVAVGVFAAATLDQVVLAGVALIAFLLVNGFLVDRFGQLSWHGAADVWRALLLVVAGAWGLAAGEAYRYVRALRAPAATGADVWAPAPDDFLKEETHDA